MLPRLLLFCWLLWAVPSLAQYPSYFGIDDENGLPSNEVYNLAQDHQGFIWLGCDAGLFKYDGIRFIAYKCPTQKSKSVTGLHFSASQRLYCLNFQGQVFYLDKDSLLELPHSFGKLFNMGADKSGNIYLNHWQGISVYNETKKTWKLYQSFDNDGVIDSTPFTKSTITDANNRTYFIHSLGIGRFANDSLSTFLNTGKQTQIVGSFLLECWKDERWIFHAHGTAIYKEKNGKFQEITQTQLNQALIDNKITNVKVLNDGYLWISTYKGMLRYQPENDIVTTFYPNLVFSDVLLDREGNYWFSTLQAGIIRVPSLEILVWNSSQAPLRQDKLIQVETDGKSIYMASVNGMLGKLDTATQQIQLYKTVSDADIQHLDYDSLDKRLYFKQKNNLFYIYPSSPQVQLHQADIPPVKSFGRVGEQYVMATSFGTYIYDMPHWTSNSLISKSWARDIEFNDIRNILWIASNDGLLRLTQQGGTWSVADTLFKATQILSIHFDTSAQVLYTLAFNGNIYAIDTALQPQFIANLPNTTQVYKILHHWQSLWIATNKGLWKYDLQTQQWKVINKLSGLASDNVQDMVILNTNIWLATGKGLVKIPLAALGEKPLAKIYIKNCFIDNMLVPQDIKFNLTYRQSLSLALEASCYSSNGQFEYAYRIQGSDSNWIKVPAVAEKIDLLNLPSGDFGVEIKLIDHLGRDSDNTLLIQGYVQPPFWQRWWFYLIPTTLILLISIWITRYRIAQIRKRQTEELRQLTLENEMRLLQQTALKAQMNPHFIFNVLNSIKGYIYENDKKNAISYLNSFSSLVRKVLNNSALPQIKLKEELELLQEYIRLEAMLLDNELDFQLYIDEAIDLDAIEIPALLLQPYIENAFKHGLRHSKKAKQLRLSFEYQAVTNALQITIADNGIGRQAAQQLNTENTNHRSFATNATAKRLELLNQQPHQSVQIQLLDNLFSPQESGTTVILTIYLP